MPLYPLCHSAQISQVLHNSDHIFCVDRSAMSAQTSQSYEQFHAHQKGLTAEPIDYNAMTIEHIAPENPKKEHNTSIENIGMLGNLIFLPEKINNGLLKNKSFADKISILKKEKATIDNYISDAKKWGDDEILARNNLLADISFKKVWKF